MKLETVNDWFPDEGSGLTAREAAKLEVMKPKTIAEVSNTATKNRPSNKIAADWSKDKKRDDNEQKKMLKSVAQHNLFRAEFKGSQETGGSPSEVSPAGLIRKEVLLKQRTRLESQCKQRCSLNMLL
jgi:hypothetical protein